MNATEAVAVLRDAIEKHRDPEWECNSDHPALLAALDATAAIAPPVAAGSVDTEALRKLAQAATRGPWRHTRQGVIVAGPFRQYTNGAAQSQIASFCVTSHEEDDEHQTEKQVPNALFSAAACPDVVLALIERAEFAQKQWDSWVASANEWNARADKAEADLKQVNEWRAAALVSNQQLYELMEAKLAKAEARAAHLEHFFKHYSVQVPPQYTALHTMEDSSANKK